MIRIWRYIVVLFVAMGSGGVRADIPAALSFPVVFDANEITINGYETVVVRIIGPDGVVHKAELPEVYFENSMATIVLVDPDGTVFQRILDEPILDLQISVYQNSIRFPIGSVPYVIRAAEANRARRVDQADFITFDELARAVGIRTASPKVSLDVNGGLTVSDRLPTDTPSNGVIYWDGNRNQFWAYQNNAWASMSWIPEVDQRSKWVLSQDPNTIYTPYHVGIGMSPGSYALAIQGNAQVTDEATIQGNALITTRIDITSDVGLNAQGQVRATDIGLTTPENVWDAAGNLTFSGVLMGDGQGLTNLNDFDDGAFDTPHFAADEVLGTTDTIQLGTLTERHLQEGALTIAHVMPDTVDGDRIGNDAVGAEAVADGAIHTRHMMKRHITSEDLVFNQFLKPKFQDKAITSAHIVAGQVTDAVLKAGAILGEHIVTGAVTSEAIVDGSLTGSHMALGSIPVDAYPKVFGMARGGTGLSAMAPQAVMISDSAGALQTDSARLMVVDGALGIGGEPEPGNRLSIRGAGDVRWGVVADDDALAIARFKNSVATWDMYANLVGSFAIGINQEGTETAPVMTITDKGYVGFGNDQPTEVMTVGGPLILGAATDNPPPGTLYYEDGQFWGVGNQPVPLSASTIQRRSVDDRPPNSSTVLASHQSRIAGLQLLVGSATSSRIYGQAVSVDQVGHSRVEGAFANATHLRNTQATVHYSAAHFVKNTSLKAYQSEAAHVSDSQLMLADSGVYFGRENDGYWMDSMGYHNHRVGGNVTGSRMDFVSDAMMDLDQSQLVFSERIQGRLVGSQLVFSSGISAHMQRSSLRFSEDSTVAVQDSWIHGVVGSRVSGRDHTIMGGSDHGISGTGYVGLGGTSHRISGDYVVGMGSFLETNASNTVLMNASDQPLTAQRSGEWAIQTDGGLRIRLSDGPQVAVLEPTDGWGHVSDKRMKTAVVTANATAILDGLRQLPIYEWAYKKSPSVAHVGPMADDFYAQWGYGDSDTTIHGVDADGVLLAGIQAVYTHIQAFTSQTDATLGADPQYDRDAIVARMKRMQTTMVQYQKKMDALDTDYAIQDRMIASIEQVEKQLRRDASLEQWGRYRGLLFALGMVGGLVFQWRRRHGR
jgi:hypothetical protein